MEVVSKGYKESVEIEVKGISKPEEQETLVRYIQCALRKIKHDRGSKSINYKIKID